MIPAKCAAIARQTIAGKLQNSRNSLLRAARESEISDFKSQIGEATEALARQIEGLGRWTPEQLGEAGALDALRGAEGMGSATYFGVFSLMLKQQRDEFAFTTRTRRPLRDRINCLLSFPPRAGPA
jgi:CRISPR-associated protein Cas1